MLISPTPIEMSIELPSIEVFLGLSCHRCIFFIDDEIEDHIFRSVVYSKNYIYQSLDAVIIDIKYYSNLIILCNRDSVQLVTDRLTFEGIIWSWKNKLYDGA